MQAMIEAIKRNKMKPRTSIYDRPENLKDSRRVNPDYLKEPTPEYLEALQAEIKKKKTRDRLTLILIATLCLLSILYLLHRLNP